MKKKPAAMWNILLLLCGIIASLFILELALRLAGFAYRAHVDISNRKTGEYRILALGESTTADLYNGQETWPGELESLLNNRSAKTRYVVYNEGLPGITTGVIVSNLKKNLNKYRPDMVITLMGVNDNRIYYRSRLGSNWLNGLRIKKLLDQISFSPKPAESCTSRIESCRRAMEDAWMFFNQERNETKAEKQFLDNYGKCEGDGIFDMEAGEFYRTLQKHEAALPFLKRAAEVMPECPEVYYRTGESYYSLRNQDRSAANKSIASFENALRIDQAPPEWAIITLGRLYVEEGIPPAQVDRYFERMGMSLNVINMTGRVSIDYTRENYNLLASELRSRKIKYLAMQYPTLDADLLRRMISDRQDIYFVENKDGFSGSEQDYSRYFIDNFPGSLEYFSGRYGHATLQGNRLIAENLAGVILNITA